MKRKNNNGMYLLNTDIDKLNKCYSVLYRDVKNDNNLSIAQRDRACEVLLLKYNFEIEELNALREVEYKTRQAKIEARNQEETPWRRGRLWRLLLKPLTNRAQDIIEEEAAQNAEERFAPVEKELITSVAKLYNLDLQELSPRKRKKILKNYLLSKHMVKVALQEIAAAALNSEAVNVAHQNDVDMQKAATEQLEEIIKAADDTAPGEAYEQPEPPANVQESESAEQPATQPPEEPGPETSETPAEQSETAPPTPHQPAKKKHKRGNKKAQAPAEQLPGTSEASTAQSEAVEQPAETLKLEEVPTAGGTQIRLQIP